MLGRVSRLQRRQGLWTVLDLSALEVGTMSRRVERVFRNSVFDSSFDSGVVQVQEQTNFDVPILIGNRAAGRQKDCG